MTDLGEHVRPKTASVLTRGDSNRASTKTRKSKLKGRKNSKSRKKSRSSSRSSRVSKASARPSSAPSLRGSTGRPSKGPKSWTFPPFGGKPISRVDFSDSMKPIWSQSPQMETFYISMSNVEKRPQSASVAMTKPFSETQERPCSAPLQKPSIRAWRRRVRGVLSSSTETGADNVCCAHPAIPDIPPYRNVPAYVDLASFLYPEYFWNLVDNFLQNQEWPKWSSLEPSFRNVCAQFNIDGATTLRLVGFAPLWVNLLRQTDEVIFRTVVGHFFYAHKFPSWSVLPRCIVEMFCKAGLNEFDYANIA